MNKIFLTITILASFFFASCNRYVEECYKITFCGGDVKCEQIEIDNSIDNIVQNQLKKYDSTYVKYLIDKYFNIETDENDSPSFAKAKIDAQRAAIKELLSQTVYVVYLKIDKHVYGDLTNKGKEKFIIESINGKHKDCYKLDNNELNVYEIYDGSEIGYSITSYEIEQQFK